MPRHSSRRFPSTCQRPAWATARGFTISELLVILLVISVVLMAMMPIIHRVRGESGQQVSAANLKALAAAHAAYSADFNDRQAGWIADDFAFTGGNPQSYAANIGCQSQLILGSSLDGGVWGYWLPCAGGLGTWSNIAAYKAISFTGSLQEGGTHRLPNARAFRTYVAERFYDPKFYAPNDTLTYELASVAFDHPAEFILSPNGGPTNPITGAAILVNSSYAFSPAAMWNPAVLSRNDDTGFWYTDPDSIMLGYRAPTVSQCAHPDLKTRMIEHNWNLGQPGPVNPAYANGITPYAFTHGIAALPLTLFFDGHVAPLPNAQVAADDAKVLAGSGGEVGLWTRDTPLGASGYLGSGTFDGFVSGHHVLTAEGILGRDMLSASGGVASSRSAPAARPASPGRRAAAGSLTGAVAPRPERLDPGAQR